MALIDEIREQPAVVERLLHRAGHELEPVARLARRNRIDLRLHRRPGQLGRSS